MKFKQFFKDLLIMSPIIIILAVLLIFGLNKHSDNSSMIQTPTVNNQEPANMKQWTEIARFTGTDSKNTDSFITISNRFKVKYATDAEQATYARLSIWVYQEGETIYEDHISLDGQGLDESIVRADAGSYYFKINEANVDSWQIIVEEER